MTNYLSPFSLYFMPENRINIPLEVEEALNATAERFGYKGKRKDAKKSRWLFLSKLLRLTKHEMISDILLQ